MRQGGNVRDGKIHTDGDHVSRKELVCLNNGPVAVTKALDGIWNDRHGPKFSEGSHSL